MESDAFVGIAKIAGIAVAALFAYVFFFILPVYRALYRKVGPNEVLVISGGKGEIVTDATGDRRRLGYRLVRGGGTLVNPLTERVEAVSLELMPFEFTLRDARTKGGGSVALNASGHARVRSDQEGLDAALEQYLSKGVSEIGAFAAQLLEGPVRATVREMTLDEVTGAPDLAAQRAREAAAAELAGRGLDLASLVLAPA